MNPDEPKQGTARRTGLEMRFCKSCAAEFQPTRRWQEFCNDKCRNNYHNDKKYIEPIKCPHCGTDSTYPNMLELLRENQYYCNFCSKIFFLVQKNSDTPKT